MYNLYSVCVYNKQTMENMYDGEIVAKNKADAFNILIQQKPFSLERYDIFVTKKVDGLQLNNSKYIDVVFDDDGRVINTDEYNSVDHEEQLTFFDRIDVDNLSLVMVESNSDDQHCNHSLIIDIFNNQTYEHIKYCDYMFGYKETIKRKGLKQAMKDHLEFVFEVIEYTCDSDIHRFCNDDTVPEWVQHLMMIEPKIKEFRKLIGEKYA